ncbi:MAG: DUF4286 family protein [Microscillaceae bacterium]|nr:DUF4286 family protein [Microscillaceae bacterium]
MITYEVRIKIDPSVESAWLHWMKTEHVPQVIATGLVRSFQILKPQEGADQVYLFHYHFDSQGDYEKYIQEFATKLRAHTQESYGGLFEASRQVYTWL